MKRLKNYRIFAALAVFAALAASCFTPLNPPPSAAAEGAGRVVLTVSPGEAAPARTVLPGKAPAFSRYELVFSSAGSDDVTADISTITADGVSQELAAGTWTAAVRAYRKFTPTDGSETEYLAAQGSASVSVTAGQVVQVTVPLAPVTDTGVKGIFTYTVKFPSTVNATITLGSVYTASLTSGNTVSVEADPGSYDLTITLIESSGTQIAGASETVYIYSGLESKAEYVFGADFSLLKGPGDTVMAETNSSSSITVSWDPVEGAATYKVYRATSADGEYSLWMETSATSYTDEWALSPGTIYYYKVSAVTGGEEGPLSDYVYAITKVSAPSSVMGEAVSSTSIRVSWEEVPGAASYKVYRARSDEYYLKEYTDQAGSSTETSFTDTGLSPDKYYYYRVSAVGNAGEGAQSSGSGAIRTLSEAEDTTIEGVYIGIIPFAGTANDLGLVRLTEAGRKTLVNRLSSNYNISSQGGTALYYAVHTALAGLKSKEDRYPEDLELVNVITFTDGLDNGSMGMSGQEPIEEKTFDSDDEYTGYLSKEIADRTIAGKSITAYSVGVRGSDVTDTAKFESNLAKIASSEDKKEILTDFDSLQTAFQGIADSLQIVQTISTTFTMKTTMLASNTKVRMTFDVTGTNPADAAASSKYIEGTITRTGTGANMTYTLKDISYTGGLDSDIGAGPITGVIDGSEVDFAFTGIAGYEPSVDNSMAKQWTMASGAAAWQVNSEYSITGATVPVTESLSTIIYLVLDASKSLNDTQIGQIKSATTAFINSLYCQLAGLIPSGVSAAAGSSSSIKVSWDEVSGASSYRVYRSASSDGTYSYVDYSNSNSTSYTDTGLAADTAYYYKVSAVMSGGSWEGTQSSAVSATTKIEPPTEVSAAAADSSSITVSWKEVSGASGYRVYRSAEHYGSYDPVGEDLPSTTTSWTDTGLEPNTAYYYYVSAYNANGEGAGASVVSATTKIGTPSGVSAAAADSSNIKVSWNQVSGASYYKVYRSASSDGVYSSTGTHITSTTWIDTGLQPNTTYYYKVSASPSYYGEDGAQSPAVSATTHANGN